MGAERVLGVSEMSETGWLSQLKDWSQWKGHLREGQAINQSSQQLITSALHCVHFLHPQSTWGLGSIARRAGAAAPLPWLQEGVVQQFLGTGSEAGIWFKSSEEEGLGLS